MKTFGKLAILAGLIAASAGLASTQALSSESGEFLPTPVYDYQATSQWNRIEPGQLVIWQGFDHEWERVVFPYKISHRISKLQSYTTSPQPRLGIPAMAHMGQDTGVDGNFMYPKTNYSSLRADALTVSEGSTRLEWTDRLNAGEYPVANNRFSENLALPAVPGNQNSTVVLRGVSLDIKCEDAAQPDGQPCNSNGAWPYFFRIDLNGCQQNASTNHQQACQLSVDFNRAWTPHQGGYELPSPLPNAFRERKPINQSLKYVLTVHYSAISGDTGAFKVVARNSNRQDDSLLSTAPKTLINHSVQPESNMTYVTAITGFSFLLSTPDPIPDQWVHSSADLNHRGRWLTKVAFSVENPQYFADASLMQATAQQTVWTPPPTVADSHVETRISTQLLAIRSSTQAKTRSATGKLCKNSTDEAPFYSWWKMCSSPWPLLYSRYGKAQTNDRVVLAAP